MSASPWVTNIGEQVRDELSCSICLELFIRPKVLPCQHTFCQDCLQDHAGAKTPFLCPNCRLQVHLSPLGVAGLPDNHLVASLCERIRSQAGLFTGLRRQSPSTNVCKTHPLEELKVFCKECNIPVCNLCLETIHDGHPTTTLKKASLERTSSVETLVTEARNLLETYCSFLRDLRDTEKSLNDQKQQTDNRICQVHDQMVQKLAETKQGLLSQVDQRHRTNIEMIQEQRETILAKVGELSAACDSAQQGMKQVEGADVFHQETNLNQVMHNRIAAPNAAQAYEVAVFQPANSPVPKLGEVLEQSFSSASTSATSGKVAKPSHLERQAAVFSPTDTTAPALQHAAVPTLSSVSLTASPSNTEVKGYWHGSEGQEDSPVQKLTFGCKGSKEQEFDVPCGVAVSDDGEIFIADCGNRRIQVFTLQGRFVRQFPTVVSENEKIQPDDIAIDTDDYLWVVGVGVAAHYTKYGTLLSTIDLRNTEWDRGVALDTRKNNILVSQTKIDKRDIVGEVQVFGRNGKLVRTVGGQQGMKSPVYITVGTKGNILVSDKISHHVYIYNEAGYLLLKFGGKGSGEGQLKCPSGICTDSSGNVIVADTHNSRVELFDKTGGWVRHVTTGMRGPLAVAMAPQGQLVVTDSSENTVTVFHSY